MNYNDYNEFPFPTRLDKSEQELKEFFMSLEDTEQLKLLTGSKSYTMFCDRLKAHTAYTGKRI